LKANVVSPEESFRDIKRRIVDKQSAIRVACELEATAPKLGNVHPAHSFSDCSHQDFMTAAARIAPVLAGDCGQTCLGQRILHAVTQTRAVTDANVNLGIILLIAPLAMIDSPADMPRLLKSLNPQDGQDVFEAIRLSSPGGMKRDDVDKKQDVSERATGPVDLVAAMTHAAHRDRIALQYADDFDDFFCNVVPVVDEALHSELSVLDGIVNVQLRLMAKYADTLIARKCGDAVAEEARVRAAKCLEADSPPSRADFDRWLRADGNRRNPGTTADFIAAALYWLLWLHD
jgi:triphosphoribosyl-dephospho-CoA synthase